MFYNSFTSNPGFIIIILLVVFGLIVFGVIMLKRHSKFFKKDDEKPTEKEIVKQELDRVLKEVDDVEVKKAMEDFEKNKTQNDETKEENK